MLEIKAPQSSQVPITQKTKPDDRVVKQMCSCIYTIAYKSQENKSCHRDT